jgi:hypothetical protein
VRTDLPRLLEHGDGQRLAAFLLLELRQTERRRHARRSAAHDENIDLERLAFGH